MNRYYSLVTNKEKKQCDINIFGEITSYEWDEKSYSSYKLSKQLEELGDVDIINLHINSCGGDVGEGLAIYNALKNHKAKVKTYCDGFACSIASVIFMAGDERIMSKASLLMIHNAWTYTMGNANELRKQADDLDKITSASINVYMSNINITEKELKKLMDNETWLDYKECIEMGFATSVIEDEKNTLNQSVRMSLVNLIKQSKQVSIDDEEEIEEEETSDEEVDDTLEDDTTLEDDEEIEVETDEDEEKEKVDLEDDDDLEESTNQKLQKLLQIIGGKKND